MFINEGMDEEMKWEIKSDDELNGGF
ncbi:hypothetical protein PT2222_220130 [Paraburkholderia tropica]